MKFDLPLGLAPGDAGAIARDAEAGAIDGVWSTEAGHDPYLPLAQVASATSNLEFGTAIAVAFPRSPMVHAQVAWDLHRMAPGRFLLGLGAQVKAHNQRRYGVPGDRPVGRMRDLICAIRAIWACWEEGTPLDYHGEFYQHTLMTPFFNPGPLGHGYPPILLAAVSTAMLKVAGAHADGVHVHPLHTEKYIDETLIPTVAAAAKEAGRDAALSLCVPFMVATGRTLDDAVASQGAMRAQIAFYGSTPAYADVLAAEGRAELAEQLHGLSRRGSWAEMPELIDDELLDAVCITAPWDELPNALAERYRGRAHRLMPYATADDGTPWPTIARELKSGLGAVV